MSMSMSMRAILTGRTFYHGSGPRVEQSPSVGLVEPIIMNGSLVKVHAGFVLLGVLFL